jgi:hypothetical protein
MRGQAPLPPIFEENFKQSLGSKITAMLHGASPDEAASARGLIAIRSIPVRFPIVQFF